MAWNNWKILSFQYKRQQEILEIGYAAKAVLGTSGMAMLGG